MTHLLVPEYAYAVEICKLKPSGGGPETLVAVKRLKPSILRNKEELINFIEECKLLRKLSHRCLICKVTWCYCTCRG